MPHDLLSARQQIVEGRRSAAASLEESLGLARDPANRHTFIRLFEPTAIAAATAADALHRAGSPVTPLAGLAISIKDLFDVQGEPTTAGAKVLAEASPAVSDCPAVARLRSAGAALIGHTNMTEFAFSAVGINPHHGTPANAATRRLDQAPRIPGGSTSGGAVSVASGAAWAALGSDTGGSIRVPAALQGLVGFKNTARLTPTEGAIPLSTTLDTACAITRSVRDAVLLHEILAQRTVQFDGRPLRAMRFAVPTTVLLDGLDSTVARAFERSLAVLRAAGAHIEDIALSEIAELPALQAKASFSPAESYAWHRELLATRGADYDPRVAYRIRLGQNTLAADYIELLHARRRWIGRMGLALHGYDALLCPTTPIVAPTIADTNANDEAFFAINSQLLRNPSMVNMLDGCALSLPCHVEGEMPVGLMVWGGPLSDDRVLWSSRAIEAALAVQSR